MDKNLKQFCRECKSFLNCNINDNCHVATELKKTCIKCPDFKICPQPVYSRHFCVSNFSARQERISATPDYIVLFMANYSDGFGMGDCPFTKIDLNETIKDMQLMVNVSCPPEELPKDFDIVKMAKHEIVLHENLYGKSHVDITNNKIDNNPCVNCNQKCLGYHNPYIAEALKRGLFQKTQ